MKKLYNAFETNLYDDWPEPRHVGIVSLEDNEVAEFLESYGFKEDEDGHPEMIYYDLEVIDDTTTTTLEGLIAYVRHELHLDDDDDDEGFEEPEPKPEPVEHNYEANEFLLVEIRSSACHTTKLMNIDTSIIDAIGMAGVESLGGSWVLNGVPLNISARDFTKSFRDFDIHERATLVNV